MFPRPVSGTPKKNSPKRLGLAALYPPGSPEDLGSSDFRVTFVAWIFELEFVSLGLASLLPCPLSPFSLVFVSCTRGYEALCTWPLQAPRVLPGPSWLQAKAVALSAHTASPLPSSAPGAPERAGEWLGGERSGAWPRPPGRLFLGLLRTTGRWLLPLASWGALSSSPTPPAPPAPAPLQPDSSPVPAQLRPGSGSSPPRLSVSPSPGRTLVPCCPSLCPSMSPAPPQPRAPPSPRDPLF